MKAYKGNGWQALLAMVMGVFVFSTITAQAAPVTGKATKTYDWGLTTSEWSCKYKARSAAKQKMNAKAKAACAPQGYVITKKAKCRVSSKLTWNGYWPEYTCKASCKGAYKCVAGGKGNFLAGMQRPQQVKQQIRQDLREEYTMLASIHDPDELLAMVEEIPDSGNVDKEEFYDAYYFDEIEYVEAPSRRQYVQNINLDFDMAPPEEEEPPFETPVEFIDLGEIKTQKFWSEDYYFNLSGYNVRQIVLEGTYKNVQIHKVEIQYRFGHSEQVFELQGILHQHQQKSTYLIGSRQIESVIVTAQAGDVLGGRAKFRVKLGIQ